MSRMREKTGSGDRVTGCYLVVIKDLVGLSEKVTFEHLNELKEATMWISR